MMNPFVAQIISELKSSEESAQNEAVVQLAMLFERLAHPERRDAVWEMILSEDLLKVSLSQQEIRELLNEAILVAEAETLHRSSKLSLVGVITRNSGHETAETVLKFFSKFADDLTEPEAFSFLEEFACCLRRIENMERLKALFEKHNTVRLLKKLRENPELHDSALRLLNYLRKRQGDADSRSESI